MPKQSLRSLEMVTLLVALDHVEEFGPAAVVPDPIAAPAECVYLKFIGEEQAAALAARLPHVEVMFRTMGGRGNNKVVRKLFSKPAILHVLRFIFPEANDYAPFVRDLASVDRKYWRVVAKESDPAEGK